MFAMNLKPSFAARFMWMATEGITARSRSTLTNFVSSFPSFAVTMRPATESGRSNHVPMSMPPYFSVDSCTYGPDFFSGLCLILKVGGVGMRGGHQEACGRTLRDAEGQERRAVARDEVFSARCQRPRVLFPQLRIAVLLQPLRKRLHGMIAAGAGGKKVKKADQ